MGWNSHSHPHHGTSICEPGIVLPSQYWSHHRSPEMRLMAAVLGEALLCITAARRKPRRKEFSDAWTWIWSDTRDWPFAFANVCDMLGVEGAAVRASICRLVAAPRRRTDMPPVAEGSSGSAGA
jgi:hypothetical protein